MSFSKDKPHLSINSLTSAGERSSAPQADRDRSPSRSDRAGRFTFRHSRYAAGLRRPAGTAPHPSRKLGQFILVPTT